MSATEVWSGDYLWRQFEAALLNPIRAFRLRYLPLLMVYFAYGATGLIASNFVANADGDVVDNHIVRLYVTASS